MIKLLGILGGLCFSYCGVPAAWATFKAKRTIGVPVSTAWLITLGGIFMYSYVTLSYGLDWILTVNYTIEVASWSVILWYNYFSTAKIGGDLTIAEAFGHETASYNDLPKVK